MIRNSAISFGVLACVVASSLPVLAETGPTVSLFERENKARDLEKQTLTGRKILVRVYNDWQADPRAYEKVGVILTGLSFSFNAVKKASANLSESAILVFAGEDQTDDLVAMVVGNYVYTEFRKKGKVFFIWPQRFDQEDPDPWTFRDALGNPVAKASVEIFLRDSPGKPEICLGKSTTDEQGHLEIPHLTGSLRNFAFIVSHPDYGISRIDRYSHNQTDIVMPLVSRTTEAYQRSIRGTVLDPEGNPVSGATIQCVNIRTLGEGLITAFRGWAYESLTDKEGAFSLYLPNERRRDDRGYLIPPKSKYNVRIEAPKELGLLPYVEPIENGRYAAILLERGGHFRTFVFEDANGFVTDPQKLRYISVTVNRPNESRLSLRYSDFKDGGIFPPGEYRAAMYGIANYDFEPLTVNEYSPDELIFKLPEGILYHGQIVHGLTGETMPGAFVPGMNSKRQGNLSMITPEQWQALHSLPTEPSLADPAVKPVRDIYGIKKLVRTDGQGRFQMSFRPGEIHGFAALEENYLGLMRRNHALVPDENRYAEVPAMKLFPAATVLVEILTKERISIWPRWIIDEDNNSVWVREFLATDDRRESMFTYDTFLEENKLQSFHVPAGLNVRVKLDCPYDEKWCPVEIPQVFNLVQGQVVDLGSYTFHPALTVSVYVTNMLDQPVEGAPVRAMHSSNAWGLPHNTDESGIARFYVIPHSEGQFGVLYHGEDGVHLIETIPYKIAGEEEAGRQFTLQLSDEMFYHLFK